MRIERLSLIRYAAYEGREITLPDAPLTVLYGPNEAGKTTLLEAIGWALFGFPSARFPDNVRRPDFRFAQPDLRLGAELSNRAGERLDFVRRKGSRKTLLDPDGNDLSDDVLLPFLGGCGRALFEELFGLDQPRLRAGGERLLAGGGALGESLLSAGAAMRDATLLRRRLEEKADALFWRDRRRKTAFTEASNAFEDARKERRDGIRGEAVLKAARAALQEAESDLAEAQTARLALDTDARRNDRLRAALPRLAELDALRHAQQEDARLHALAPDLREKLRDTALALLAAQERRMTAEQALARLRAQHDAVPMPSAAWQHRGEIDSLYRALNDIEGQQIDLQKREAERAAAQRELDTSAGRLGLSRDVFDAREIDDPTLATLRAALDTGRDNASELQRAEKAVTALRRELEAAGGGETGAETPNPARYRRELDELRDLPAKKAQAEADRQAASAALQALDTEAARLSPAMADIAALRGFSPPPESRIAETETALDRHRAAREALATRARTLEAEAERHRAQLASLSGESAPPTRARLEEARSARDGAWRLIRHVRLEGGAGEPPAPDAFEHLMADADRLADRREADAAAVERREAAEAALRKCREDQAALEAETAALETEAAGTGAGWAALWAPLVPGSPREMRDWIAERRVLLTRAAEAGNRAAEASLAGERVEADRARLDRLAETVGIAAPAPTPPETLLLEIDRHIEAMEIAHEQRAAREAALRSLRTAEAERAALKEAQGAWEAAWQAQAVTLGLAPDSGIEAARAALDCWRVVPSQRLHLRDTEDRITKMRANIETFRQRAGALLATLGETAPPGPALAAIERLQESREQDQKRADERQRLADEIRQADALLASETTLLQEAEAAFARIGAEAGMADAEPARLPERVEHLAGLEARIAEKRAVLRDVAPEEDEAALRAALGETTAEEIAARLAAIEPERAEAQARVDTATEARSEARRALEALEQPGQEAEATQRMRDAEAAMELAAQEWLTLRTASLLLTAATKHYRDANADPVIESATSVFSRLTLGGFNGLRVELDEADEDKLRAIRATGEAVGTEGLSEGTLDQLFLALRLAAIERRLEESEPIPFIGDDLFTSFDDARMQAGLEVLLEFGSRTQTLMFTHHRRVADAAGALPGATVIEIS